MDILHRVGPHAVDEPVFPKVIAGCHGDMMFVDQHCLDACAAELDAEKGLVQIHRYAHGFSDAYGSDFG